MAHTKQPTPEILKEKSDATNVVRERSDVLEKAETLRQSSAERINLLQNHMPELSLKEFLDGKASLMEWTKEAYAQGKTLEDVARETLEIKPETLAA